MADDELHCEFHKKENAKRVGHHMHFPPETFTVYWQKHHYVTRNYIWSSSGGNSRGVSDAVCFCFAFCFVCESRKKKLRNLDARHVCALLKAEHLGCHSWHSCKALKAAKAKTTISRQAADLQIWQLLSVIGGWHSTRTARRRCFPRHGWTFAWNKVKPRLLANLGWRLKDNAGKNEQKDPQKNDYLPWN